MTHDTLNGTGFLKSSFENWQETNFDIDYHIKGNTEINLGIVTTFDFTKQSMNPPPTHLFAKYIVIF